MSLKAVGMEVANSFVKVKSYKGEGVYLNTIKEHFEDEEQAFFGSLSDGTRKKRFKYQGRLWSIGETRGGVSSSGRDSDRYATDSYKAQAMIALAQFVESGDELKVVTGLPANHYRKQNAEHLVEEALRGEHVVTVDGNPVKFNVRQVVPVLQPMGTLYYLMLNDDGTPRPDARRLRDAYKAIVDIGFGSTDVAILDGAELVEYFVVNVSMVNAYERILRTVKLQNELTPLEAEQQLREQDALSFGGRTYDVEEIKRNAFKTTASEIIAGVKNRVSLERMDATIFTGGGVKALYSGLRDQLENVPNAVPVKDPQPANARGFWLYGMYKK